MIAFLTLKKSVLERSWADFDPQIKFLLDWRGLYARVLGGPGGMRGSWGGKRWGYRSSKLMIFRYLKGNYEKHIRNCRMRRLRLSIQHALLRPHKGGRAADCLPQGGSPPPARLFDLCDLMQGLEDLRMEETVGHQNRTKTGPMLSGLIL